LERDDRPSCAAKRAAALAAFLREEVLADVGRAQWVFSIPKMLRPYVLYHRPLLGWLCRAAYETAREMIGAALPAKERARLLLSWRHSGFSVHTSVTVPPGDGEGLERLARYLLRPPVSLERLHLDEPARTIAYARRPGHASWLPAPAAPPPLDPDDSLARMIMHIPETRVIGQILKHLAAKGIDARSPPEAPPSSLRPPPRLQRRPRPSTTRSGPGPPPPRL
jgi:hypothetical protein